MSVTRKALYPGSFDPITNGHIDILERSCRLFDEIHVGVIQNPDKKGLFEISERITLIQEVMGDRPQIKVEGFKGLLVDYVQDKQIFTIIRGLRAVSDFDYEFQLYHTNRQLNDKIESIFMMTSLEHAYLSSSLVKQVALLGGDVSQFVPPAVEKELLGKKS